MQTHTFALEKSICCATSFNDANYVPVQSTDRFRTITKCEQKIYNNCIGATNYTLWFFHEFVIKCYPIRIRNYAMSS